MGVSIYLGNGDGTFDLDTVYPGTQNGSVAIGDFNGDDVPDVLGVPGMLLLGTGDGGFDTYNVSSGSYFTGVADLDGDGLDDYAYPRQLSGDVKVMLSNGDGSFAQAALPLVGDTSPSCWVMATARSLPNSGIPSAPSFNRAHLNTA